MNIRLIGLPAEVDPALHRLGEAFDVISASAPYPCRGQDRRVRVYLEVQPWKP